jgi:hypothetical protein
VETGHHTPELVWGRAGVLLKKTREIAVGAEPELVRNSSDVLLLLTERSDSGFNPKCIAIDRGAHSGAMAEQVIEVRPRQARQFCNPVKIEGFTDVIVHVVDGSMDAEITRRAPAAIFFGARALFGKSVHDFQTEIEDQVFEFL